VVNDTAARVKALGPFHGYPAGGDGGRP
jgi:hypothetical protein